MKKSDVNRISLGLALAVASLLAIVVAPSTKTIEAQTRNNARSVDKSGKYIQEIGSQLVYSPIDSGMNAVTLPASLSTVNSTILDTAGVKEIVIIGACTQVASLTVNMLDSDKQTTILQQSVETAIPTTGGEFAFGNESPSNVVAGTAVAGAAGLRTPIPAISFFFTNSGATPGTCTARVFMQF